MGEYSAARSEQDMAPSRGYAWQPTETYLTRSRLRRFMAAQGIDSLAELQRRSVADIAWFWDAVVKDLGLEFFEPYQQVVDLSRGIPWARWFVGGKYNYVHNALDRHASPPPTSAEGAKRRRGEGANLSSVAHTSIPPLAHSGGAGGGRMAVVWEGEDGAVRQLTYADLADLTNRFADGLRNLGIGPGDRVGIFMPMIPEIVAATLACGKIGAIFTPCFSGYAAPAVASRLRDCGARALITADGFFRRGSVVPMGATAKDAADQAPSVEHVVVCRRLGNVDVPTDARTVFWDDVLSAPGTVCPTFQTEPHDPYMIIYTSGTTGRPKGAVHVHAGFPVKATQDLAHCFDLQSDDVLFWLTDLGWMMGPWAIAGGLTLGATLCLYEGAIDYPKPDRLWEIVERHRATVLGISPTAVRALIPHGDDWVERHDRSSLRVFGSTGEPWNPDPWWWLFRTVGGERCPIVNYSGGTEISGGIVGGFTIAPVKPCAFVGAVPGIDADVVDENGQPIRGAVGELVIRQPWVGMTNGFWQDPERYLETYWSRWPDTWVHGDWAMIDDDGAWYILGRSDDTIKLAGKRVGPAEVESAAVAHPAVREAVAIGVPHDVKGEALVVLAILKPDRTPSEDLRQEIQEMVTSQLGRALRPEEVRFVADLPRTRNAKMLRRVIRAAFLGKSDLGDLSSLENPSSIDAVRQST
jgi:acetyl-CoA synthetase